MLFFTINFMIMQHIKKFNNNIFILNSKDLITQFNGNHNFCIIYLFETFMQVGNNVPVSRMEGNLQ